jgi:hypothetical protein
MRALSPETEAHVILDFKKSAEIGLHLMSRVYQLLAAQRHDHLTTNVANTIVRPAMQERNEGTILTRYRDKNIDKMIGASNTSVPSAPKPKLTEEQRRTLEQLKASKDLSAPQPPSIAQENIEARRTLVQHLRERRDLPLTIYNPILNRLRGADTLQLRRDLDDCVNLTLNLAEIARDKNDTKGNRDRFIAYSKRLLFLLDFLIQNDYNAEATLLQNTLALITPTFTTEMGNILDLLFNEFTYSKSWYIFRFPLHKKSKEFSQIFIDRVYKKNFFNRADSIFF